jgi:vanillate O-demethylase ferredoxin subunit
MPIQIRTGILRLHRWAGLTLALLVAWLALTGAGMLFAPQLRSVVDHDLDVVPVCTDSLPLDSLLDKARAVHLGGTVRLIGIREQKTASVLVRFGNGDTVYLNPCTGHVLGERNKSAGLFGTLEYLHRLKWFGMGSSIVGAGALLFALVVVIGGIVTWWPGSRRALRAGLTFSPRLVGRARLMNQHRVLGIWISFVLLASALTGPIDSFSWYRRAIEDITRSAVPEAVPSSRATDRPRLSIQALWDRVRSVSPVPIEALIAVPKQATSAVEFDFLQRGAPHPEARTLMYLDAYTGAVLSFRPYASTSAANKIMGWGLAIHKGEAGVIAQALLLLGALGAPVLVYTGISSYLRRRLILRR